MVNIILFVLLTAWSLPGERLEAFGQKENKGTRRGKRITIKKAHQDVLSYFLVFTGVERTHKTPINKFVPKEYCSKLSEC